MSTFYLTVFCEDVLLETCQIISKIIYRIITNIDLVLKNNWKDVLWVTGEKEEDSWHCS